MGYISQPMIAADTLIYKQSGGDLSVNNSAVLVNIPGLTCPIAASGVLRFRVRIFCFAGATPDIKFAVTAPAGATTYYSILDDTAAAVLDHQNATGPNTIAVSTAGAATFINIDGVCINGATAGSIQVQFAQNTATVENTTVYGASCLEVINF